MVDLDAKTQKVIVSMATKDKVQRQNIMTTLQQIQSGAMLRGTEILEAVTESKLTEYQKQLILTKLGLNQATAENTVLNTQNTISLIEKILTQKGADKANKQESIGILANIAATKQQTNANYSLSASMKALQASMGVWGWISIAVSFLIPVIMELVGGIKSANEQLEETKQALADIRSESENLNNELTTTRERIAELEGKSSLSIMEKEELDKHKAFARALLRAY